MYVYIWKDASGIPFYVGMGTTMRRTNPKNKGHRNKACLQKLNEIGADSVVIEIHTTASPEDAKLLEQQLISKYGRLRDGTGTLTNISKGGEFHALSTSTTAKLKALWDDPTHREKVVTARKQAPRILAESTRQVLRENIARNPAMLGWDKRNGQDPEFDAKRIAGIRAAQDKRREKMADPEALAQRKARLKATLNSPEYKAKRAAMDTPEYRAKLSAAKKAYWERKKAIT